MGMNSIHVVFAEEDHAKFADEICRLIYESALQRGTGIAKRSPEYIASKIKGGKAVVALDGDRLVGFSYIECWEHGDYVASDRESRLPPHGFGGADQGEDLRTSPTTIPVC